jgi:hypothetical protein
MAVDVAVAAAPHSFANAADGLARMPYLGLTSDDGLAGDTDALIAAIRAKGGMKATTAHAPTDHGWNDHRIALEALIINWLAGLQ